MPPACPHRRGEAADQALLGRIVRRDPGRGQRRRPRRRAGSARRRARPGCSANLRHAREPRRRPAAGAVVGERGAGRERRPSAHPDLRVQVDVEHVHQRSSRVTTIIASMNTPACTIGKSSCRMAPDDEAPDARDREHRLGDHRAAEEEPELQAGHGDDAAARRCVRAWRQITSHSDTPLARAVRT